MVDNTQRLLAFLDGLGREYEVIIGSNGSTDSTTALGVDLSRRFKPVTFFHLPQRGVGLAFREFVRRARHPFLISLDMDLSVDLSFVPTALDLLETNDIVVGSKKLGNQSRSLFRRLGSELFLRAMRLLLGIAYEGYSIAAKAFPGGNTPALHRPHRRGLLVRARDLLSHPPHGRERHPGAGLVRGLARLEVQPPARGVLQVPAPPRALAALPAGRRVA